MSAEALGVMVFVLVMLGLSIAAIGHLMSGGDLVEAERSISTLRDGLRGLYKGAPDYGDLSNEVAVAAGVVPVNMRKTSGLRNGWNGAVTLRPSAEAGAFDIEYQGVPREAAVKLATHQRGSWVSVTLNGQVVDQSATSVAAMAAMAADGGNTLVFTSN